MHGVITPLWKEPVKHIYHLLRDRQYRNMCELVSKYKHVARYSERHIHIDDLSLRVPDIASFLFSYQEIFVDESYAFPAENPAPYIIDCGANIGLSVLYFKRRFPRAKIMAFEPDPGIFAVLQENMLANGITDVDLINKAVWTSNTNLEFSSSGADSGRIALNSDTNLVTVPATRLSTILGQRPVDFLKMDIEGAEIEVIKDCAQELAQIRYVFVEFHSFTNKQQELGQLLQTFEAQGFRLHVRPEHISKRPFLGVHQSSGMDLQLNLFFWRSR